MITIAQGLKDARLQANMSVKEISQILSEKGYKASEKTIYSWESGRSEPSPGALLEMCKAYGIDDVLSTFGYTGYNEDGSIRLNMLEIEIIEKYRVLDTHGKDMVDTVLDKEYDRCQIIRYPREQLKDLVARNEGKLTEAEEAALQDIINNV